MKPKERIPLHDHSGPDDGGRLAAQNVTGLPTLTTTTTSAGSASILNDLGDVDLVTTPPANNDALTYDSATGQWVPEAITATLTVKDEGSPLATAADTLDFVGAGVVASGTGSTKTITITGATVADILDLTTAETDSALVLAPDGAGGVEFRAEAAGGGTGSAVRVYIYRNFR